MAITSSIKVLAACVAVLSVHAVGDRLASGDDGSIVAWGKNVDGQCDVPAPNTDFVAVAGGSAHSLGLKADGSILAWGRNVDGQCDVPAPNTDFVAVAGGKCHSLGLKADGSIVGWGRNYSGECNVPAPNTDFVAVVGGEYHSLGLKADGSIVAWGGNDDGQCDVPAPNMDFVALATGDRHSLGLKANGSIVAWGRNNWGQCDVPTPNAGFVAVGAGVDHSLGVKADGSIVAWGYNFTGACNVPEPNMDFVAAAGGIYHSLGLVVAREIVAVTYDGDAVLSTQGQPTVDANLVATLRDDENNVLYIDGEEVTFTLTADGVQDIVVTALSMDGVAHALWTLEPAVYSIEITLASSDLKGYGILVVYNPDGGHATGGGWIVPEDNGLNTHPNVRANFGFNAKYKEGEPTGHIQFRYSDGYINLNSTSIEQMVITGGRIVQFRGWARVNGEEGNWFFAKGIDDGDPGVDTDSFEIKTWAPGADPEGDPTERAAGLLQGGNIVVHTH
jgi:alpha-tubulin suppressor-like RCC1 family protein